MDKRNKDKVVEILSQQASQGTLVIVVTHGPYLTKIGETNEKTTFFSLKTKKMSGKSNIKESDLNIPTAVKKEQKYVAFVLGLVALK
ncbi:hypothetical protein I8F73_03940 [Enterococcus faecalis]|nr:hypothetical protein [Enterococcus faecalis]